MNATNTHSNIDTAEEEAPAAPLPAPPNEDDLIYEPTESVEDTLKTFANILNTPPFALLARLKLYVPSTKSYENLMEFTPSELPIVERIRREIGVGAYEVWVYNRGKIYKRLKLDVSETNSPRINNNSVAMGAPDVLRAGKQESPQVNTSESRVDALERRLSDSMRENERLRSGGESINRGRSRGRGRHRHQPHQNSTQDMRDTVSLFKEMGLIPESKRPVEPSQTFDEILEDRINTSKILGFERPEGGTADMNNGASFMDSDLAREALGSLLGIAGPAFEVWKMGVHLKKDELRMANGLAPIHLGDQVVPPAPTPPPPPPGAAAPETTASMGKEGNTARESPKPNAPYKPTAQEFEGDKKRLQVHMLYLVQMAEAGTDTLHWADCTLDLFEEEFLIDTIMKPGVLEGIAAIKPELAKHKPWFVRFVDDLRERVKEMDEDDPARVKLREDRAKKAASVGKPKPDVVQQNAPGKTNDKNTAHEKAAATPKGDRPDKGTHEEADKKEADWEKE